MLQFGIKKVFTWYYVIIRSSRHSGYISHVIRRRLDMLREISGFKVRRLDIHDLHVKGFPMVYGTCQMDEWKASNGWRRGGRRGGSWIVSPKSVTVKLSTFSVTFYRSLTKAHEGLDFFEWLNNCLPSIPLTLDGPYWVEIKYRIVNYLSD